MEKDSTIIQKMNEWVTMHLTSIPFVQKIFFVEHLRTMVHAGISLVEALRILGKEMENPRFKKIVGFIKSEVEGGKQLSEVLAKYPEVFPSVYIKMIGAGETSGQLETSLEQVEQQMKKNQELISSIRGAMIYPSVVLAAMGGIGILMVTVVLPKLIVIFKDFDAELPLATRMLIVLTDFMSNPVNLSILTVVVVGLITTFIMLLRRVPKFRHGVHTLNLHLPIAGPIIKQINLARFSLTLSSLLKSTIPIIHAVEITADTCTNIRYKEAITSTAEEIKKGINLSDTLGNYPNLFPPIVTEMIMVGERSGQIDQLLQELATFYSKQVDKTMKNFATIVEPVIILTLGVAVGGMAVAVIMPMYSLVQNF
ncbi:MAG: type II secretion system F family protein [Candidatus Magasanikbacteria bacterium]|nr:type II secretion system F family protein [Candidatus Magasanikbacteria bacterium]